MVGMPRGLRRALSLGCNPLELRAGELMNVSPVVVPVEALIGDALNIMETPGRKVFAAPVVDNAGVCLGVLVLHDLLGPPTP